MNNSLLTLLFLIVIFLITSALILYFLPVKKLFSINKLLSVIKLKKSMGNSIEDGNSVHISIGKSALNDIHGAASFIGLDTTNKLLSQIILSDNPPTVTSGSGDITLLSQTSIYDTLGMKSKFSQTNEPSVYLCGATNLSYIAGAIPPTAEKGLSSQVFVGNFGPEIGLVLHESNKKNHFSLAATDNLEGQAVSYVYAKEPILGDQIFSLPGQITNDTKNHLSIYLQDILRWIIIFFIFILIFLKLIGLL